MAGQIHCGLSKRRGCAADDDGLSRLHFENAKESRPGRRVGFRNGRQVLPFQIRRHGRHIARRHRDQFGVTAVQIAAHAANDGQHALAYLEPALRIGLDHTDALDPGDLGHIAPRTAPKVDLGMIEPEGLHPDDHVPRYRLGVRAFLELQNLGSAILRNDDGLHLRPPNVDWRTLRSRAMVKNCKVTINFIDLFNDGRADAAPASVLRRGRGRGQLSGRGRQAGPFAAIGVDGRQEPGKPAAAGTCWTAVATASP